MFAYAVRWEFSSPRSWVEIQQTYKVGMYENSELKSSSIALARSKDWTYSTAKGGFFTCLEIYVGLCKNLYCKFLVHNIYVTTFSAEVRRAKKLNHKDNFYEEKQYISLDFLQWSCKTSLER